MTVNGQSAAILPVLVFGAGTDYALLLVSRYREELRQPRGQARGDARSRCARAGPAILASGLHGDRRAAVRCRSPRSTAPPGLGPIGAMGIAVAMISMLTLLPALLAIFGRRAFWSPVFWTRIPHFGDSRRRRDARLLAPGRRARRPPPAARSGSAPRRAARAARSACSTLDTGLTSGNSFRGEVESVEGQELLAQPLPGRRQRADRRSSSRPRADVEAVTAAARATSTGVAEVAPPPSRAPPGVLLSAVLERRPVLDRGLRPDPRPARGASRQAGGAGRARRRPDGARARPPQGGGARQRG